MERRLAAILAADVVGYSRLMGLDEDRTLAAFNDIVGSVVKPVFENFKGRIFKWMGDGFLAEFPSAKDAVSCALNMQRAIAAEKEDNSSEFAITFRVGVNMGDIIVSGEDILGDGVNIAARLESAAPDGGVLIADIVFGQLNTELREAFSDAGRIALKNISEPVRVWRWDGLIADLKQREDKVLSIEANQSKRGRRQRNVAVLLGGLALATGAASYLALSQLKSTAEREARIMTSLSERSLEQKRYNRAMRVALLGLPSPGALPYHVWSADLEDKLRGAAMLSHQISRLRGHKAGVLRASFSPDENTVVTASADHTAIIWDVKNAEPRAILEGHTDVVSHAEFDKSGSRILTSSNDGTVVIWDAVTGRAVTKLIGHGGGVTSAHFSPNGESVVSGSVDRTARVWDSETGAELVSFSVPDGFISKVRFSTNGDVVCVGTSDGLAILWDINSGVELARLAGHTQPITDIAFGPGGRQVLTTSADELINLWDSGSGKPLAQFAGHEGVVSRVVFSADGSRVFSASFDGTMRIWDVQSGAEMKRWEEQDQKILDIDLSPENDSLILATSSGKVYLWDLQSSEVGQIIEAHDGPISDVSFSASGKSFIAVSGDKTSSIWNPFALRQSATLSPSATSIFSVSSLAPHGAVAIGVSENMIVLWNLKTGRQASFYNMRHSVPNNAILSRDGKFLAANAVGGGVTIWDVQTQEVLFDRHFPKFDVSDLFFDDESQRFAMTTRDGRISVWHIASKQLVATMHGHKGEIADLEFSSDGKWLVTGSYDKTARIWDAETGKQIAVLLGHGGNINRVQISSDGTRILSQGYESSARIWRRDNPKEYVELVHSDTIWSASFTEQGDRVVTTSADDTAKIWDAQSGTVLVTFERHDTDVRQALFSPDGRYVITKSTDGVVKIWNSFSGNQIASFASGLPGSEPIALHSDPETSELSLFAISRTSAEAIAKSWTLDFLSNVDKSDLQARICAEKLIGESIIVGRDLNDPILKGLGGLNVCNQHGPLDQRYWKKWVQ